MLFFTVYVLRDMLIMVNSAQENEIIRALAYKDSLTGMNNRTAFMEAEKRLIEEDSEKPIGIIQFDINNLKKVNDSKGHGEGDRCIISCANIIRECVGATGKCYRVGGDEFIVIINSVNAERKIEKIIQMLIERQKNFPYQIAYGSAIYHKGERKSLEEIEQEADQRMYERKREMKGLLK